MAKRSKGQAKQRPSEAMAVQKKPPARVGFFFAAMCGVVRTNAAL